MTDYFHDTAHNPPPIAPMIVLARHGAKFKVRLFGSIRIMDRGQVLHWASNRRAAGATVKLNGLVRED